MNIKSGKLRPDSLSVLRASHNHIETTLQLMQIVVSETPVEGLPPPDRANLECLLEILPHAFEHHVQSQEKNIFPTLTSEVNEDLIERLETEHHHALRLQRQFVELGLEWLEYGSQEDFKRRKLNQAAQELIILMNEHIKVERRELLPFFTRKREIEGI